MRFCSYLSFMLLMAFSYWGTADGVKEIAETVNVCGPNMFFDDSTNRYVSCDKCVQIAQSKKCLTCCPITQTTTKALLVKTKREEQRTENLLGELESSAVKLDAGRLNRAVMIITFVVMIIAGVFLVILCILVFTTPKTDGEKEPYVDHSTSSDDHVTGMVAVLSEKP